MDQRDICDMNVNVKITINKDGRLDSSLSCFLSKSYHIPAWLDEPSASCKTKLQQPKQATLYLQDFKGNWEAYIHSESKN